MKSTPLGVSNVGPGAVPLKDVADFITKHNQATAQTSTPGVLPGPVEVPLSPQVEQFVQVQESGATHRLPEPSIPQEPALHPDMPTHSSMTAFSLGAEGSPIAELTQTQKDAYIKAVLFDEHVVWDIPVLGGRMAVKVRTLGVKEETRLTEWLVHLEETKEVTTQLMHLSWLQRAHVILRVLGVTAEGKETLFTTDGFVQELNAAPDKETAVALLDKHMRKAYAEMKNGRYGAMLEAVRQHERLVNVCHRNAASGNFWLPGATA